LKKFKIIKLIMKLKIYRKIQNIKILMKKDKNLQIVIILTEIIKIIIKYQLLSLKKL